MSSDSRLRSWFRFLASPFGVDKPGKPFDRRLIILARQFGIADLHSALLFDRHDDLDKIKIVGCVSLLCKRAPIDDVRNVDAQLRRNDTSHVG